MIVLDTNVVSETMKAAPNPVARACLDAQAAETLYRFSITHADLMFGIGLSAPAGYIATVATARALTVATRDVAPFQAVGINVFSPWEVRQQAVLPGLEVHWCDHHRFLREAHLQQRCPLLCSGLLPSQKLPVISRVAVLPAQSL